MKNKTSSVLITGVAGMIGSRMADWILANHSHLEVVGVDNLSGGYRENVASEVTFYKVDCTSNELDKVFEQHQPQYVFHFAAYAAEGLSPFIRKFNYQNNLVATANVVNACIEHEVERLVFTSSMAVYGVGDPPFAETHQPKPIDPYGVAKFACELDIQIAGEQHGLDWCIIRPHNVYGTKQNIWDPYRNVLGIWMYQILQGAPLTIYGEGNQKRAFSSIDDMLQPLWSAAIKAEASKEIFNLGSAKSHTIQEAARILINVVGRGEIQFVEQRHEVSNAHPTWQKSVDYLGFNDQTDLKTGLAQMWQWVQNQPAREPVHFDEYELEKGIYTFWKKK